MSAPSPSQSLYRRGIGIVLCNRSGLIFCGRRRDGRAPPWQMPQGGLLPDEAPHSAVMRELREEIGSDAATIIAWREDWLSYDYPDATSSRRTENFRGQSHLWFLLRFDGQDRDICLISPHSEFTDWCWNTPEQTISGVIAFKRPIYRAVLQGFAEQIRALHSEPLRSLA